MQKLIAVLLIVGATSLMAGNGESDSQESVFLSPDMSRIYLLARKLNLDGQYTEAAQLMEKILATDPNNALLNHQLSEIYLKVGDADRAEELAKKAASIEPDNMAYQSMLGMIYAQLRRFDKSKEAYEKVVRADPTDVRTYLLIGIVEAEAGQFDNAIKTLTTAILKNPDSYMAYFYRAKIYIEMNKLDKAKNDLAKSMQLRPGFKEAGLALGMLYERENNTAEAIKVYNRIQGGGRYKKRLAQLYLQNNEIEKALNALLEYEQVEPDDYGVRVKIALILFELQRFDDAVARFEKILAEEPGADNIRFYLGGVYEESGKFDQAIAEFKKVNVDSSFYKESMLHIGFIYKKTERLSEGISFAKDLISKRPDVPEFYDMRAAFHEAKKDYDEALAVIDQGLKKFPTDEKLLYFQGALFDKIGKKEQGIANMRKILELNEKNAHALNFLGYTYAEMGSNLEEAEGLVKRALEIRPDDGFIIDSLGWILFKRGKINQAIQQLEKAAKLQPDEAIIFEHLGDVYFQKKKFGEASDMYQKAFKLSQSKDSEMAKKLEKKIANVKDETRAPSNSK